MKIGVHHHLSSAALLGSQNLDTDIIGMDESSHNSMDESGPKYI